MTIDVDMNIPNERLAGLHAALLQADQLLPDALRHGVDKLGLLVLVAVDAAPVGVGVGPGGGVGGDQVAVLLSRALRAPDAAEHRSQFRRVGAARTRTQEVFGLSCNTTQLYLLS